MVIEPIRSLCSNVTFSSGAAGDLIRFLYLGRHEPESVLCLDSLLQMFHFRPERFESSLIISLNFFIFQLNSVLLPFYPTRLTPFCLTRPPPPTHPLTNRMPPMARWVVTADPCHQSQFPRLASELRRPGDVHHLKLLYGYVSFPLSAFAIELASYFEICRPS